MTNSILINYTGYPNEPFNLMPDNGLANLAACLLEAGHRTVIWDCATIETIRRLYPYEHREALQDLTGKATARLKAGEEIPAADREAFYRLEDEIDLYQAGQVRALAREISGYVREKKVDFVGMKLWTGAGFHGAMIIAEQLKRDNPGIFVFGGGPHVDWFHERIYNVTDIFDALAFGDGEETIVLLAEYAAGRRPLDTIPNLIFKRNGTVVTTPGRQFDRLDALPLPVYDADIYPAMRGNQKIKAVLYDDSRGCPNTCSFCIHPGKSGHRRRLKEVSTVVDGLEQMNRKYGFSAFRLAGSNPPARFLRQVAEEIIARRLRITYSAYAHVRGFSREDFDIIKRSGCCALSFGVESGSQEILDRSINKKVRVSEIRDTLTRCRAAGIKISASIIMPAPFETDATRQETFSLLTEVRPESTIVCFPALVLGTEWEKNREKFGFSIRFDENYFDRLMTFRVNHLFPPVLWRQLLDYSLNGKTFGELGRETAGFVKSLERAGLTTQLFDQTLLIADCAGMPAAEFGQAAHRCLFSGDDRAMESLAARVNERVLTKTACTASYGGSS